MGRYFGLFNATRNQSVSEGRQCWKAYPFCSCHAVMHRYHWQPTDEISSAAYDSCYKFIYDVQKNEMDLVNGYEYEDFDGENDELPEFEDGETPAAADTENPDAKKAAEKEEEVPEPVQLGFGVGDAEMEGQYDHVPVWDGDVCIKCAYRFDPEHIVQDAQKFDPVFYRN
jgi:hypothetical protein